jgi:hypothetical protein
VQGIEALGHCTLATLERDGLRLTGQLDGSTQVHEGQTTEVVIDMSQAHWFDAATGNALNGRPAG